LASEFQSGKVGEVRRRLRTNDFQFSYEAGQIQALILLASLGSLFWVEGEQRSESDVSEETDEEVYIQGIIESVHNQVPEEKLTMWDQTLQPRNTSELTNSLINNIDKEVARETLYELLHTGWGRKMILIRANLTGYMNNPSFKPMKLSRKGVEGWGSHETALVALMGQQLVEKIDTDSTQSIEERRGLLRLFVIGVVETQLTGSGKVLLPREVKEVLSEILTTKDMDYLELATNNLMREALYNWPNVLALAGLIGVSVNRILERYQGNRSHIVENALEWGALVFYLYRLGVVGRAALKASRLNNSLNELRGDDFNGLS
jgi:hypothetical protein